MSVLSRQRSNTPSSGQVQVQPVSLWQETLLKIDEHPECAPDFRQTMILSHAMRVKPKLDKRRLQRALDKLFFRHDSLRIRFDRVKGKWRAIISPPGSVEIAEIDASGLDAVNFEAAVVEAANRPMPLVGGPMAEVVLLKGGAHGDAVIARIHHAISDGFGMIVMFEDLFKFLIGLPVVERAVGHAEYVAKYQSPPPERVAEIDAFWADYHRDFPPTPMFGRLTKGRKNPSPFLGEREARTLTLTVGKDSQKRLEAWGAKLNIAVPTLIFAAHYQAICERFDMDRVAFMSHVTRSDPRLGTFMGDHTLDPLLIYRRVQRADFESAVISLNETFMSIRDHLPSTAARMCSDYWDDLVARGSNPGQFAAYQPRAIARENRSIFKHTMRSALGTEFRMGPYTLSSFDADRSTRISVDLQVKIDPLDPRTFRLRYDALSLDDHEVQQVADVMGELLSVDFAEVAQS